MIRALFFCFTAVKWSIIYQFSQVALQNSLTEEKAADRALYQYRMRGLKT
ncbi:hypothetical protein HMPREF2738_02102 [Clostridiales bacterium KLE1615]|nr:hypothetical protein HMPREF2738_02102 [Clostridiales bacterium KLE1615]